ncbi:MAG: hypothetical protein JSW66_00800 [Phycisphaerales bacterium]|nr:MAG: hypothetical protein JSW66_00800 [Phycisphaerales bacterium]
MDQKETEKTPIAVSKSFLAVGPTLHYSHKNVQRCWLLAVMAFGISCLFWSKIVTGSFWSFDFQTITTPEFPRLGDSITTGVSIFEYPWQILVLGLLMGILAAVPVLISQLMCFRYSIIFILAVCFLANLPVFAMSLLISCFAAACRPLRFRSRFIAIALCTAPQLLYWGHFGGARGVEPIEWGYSFAPWTCAWLDALTIAGFVLGIGHFTRYRPGLVWIFTSLTLVIAVVVFEVTIGFDELDYQLYVAKNNPEHASEFHDHSITEILDQTMKDPATQEYLDESFYPADPIARRAELKRDIQEQLNYGWPEWLTVPPELMYKEKKEALREQYDFFINRRQGSRRMPIALYFKALLAEYSPDTRMLGQKEALHFYSDYPHERASRIWWALYQGFGNSAESIEARWRVAMQWAGRGLFEQADELLTKAQTMLAAEQSKLLEAEQAPSGKLSGLFRPPVDSVMTSPKLSDLQRRIHLLRILISPENRTDQPGSEERLAKFVMLNPHAADYAQHLDGLLEQTEDGDRLRDNILLAQAKLIADEQLRAEKLGELHKEYGQTDAGMLALYDLGLLKISLWRQQDEANEALKKKALEQARVTLNSFISLYPNSFYAEQVKRNLDGLPAK